MRVAIAGSSGMLGTSLVPALRQGKHEVVRLVRRQPEAPDERRWDPVEGVLDDGALDGVEAVINLCGAGPGDKRWTADRKALLLTSRTNPTSVLARAVAQQGVPLLVNASATGYYGDAGDATLTESSPSGTGFMADMCRQWEAATAPAEQAGARVVRARTGVVLTPSGGMLGQLKPVFKLLLGGHLGSGLQYVPWISLDDEVAAFRFALETPGLHGPVNFTGPVPVTNTEFTRSLGAAVGRPTPWAIPGFAVRAVYGEMADELALVSQRAVPEQLKHHGFSFQHPSVDAALVAAVQA